jgi:DNA-binding CsgD family transcriptional regulator
LPVGTVFRATDLASIEVMRSGPLYEQIAVPAGLEYVLGVILENTPSFFSNLCWMRAGDDFTAADKAILHTLVPHLQTALRISGRIAFGDAGRREALLSFDRARQPVVVLDRSGYAIFTNDSARRVLEKADGVALKFGRFLFQNILTQTEFERVVRLAMAATQRDAVPAPYEVRVPRRGPGTPYAMSVIPVSRSSDRAVLPDGAGCLILIYDLEVPNQLPVERLAWLYRLTPAEVRVCESLFRVGSVDSAALDLSLTRNTVRSHLKSVYTKFGVATQGQLMQRLANSLRLSEGIDREPAN